MFILVIISISVLGGRYATPTILFLIEFETFLLISINIVSKQSVMILRPFLILQCVPSLTNNATPPLSRVIYIIIPVHGT